MKETLLSFDDQGNLKTCKHFHEMFLTTTDVVLILSWFVLFLRLIADRTPAGLSKKSFFLLFLANVFRYADVVVNASATKELVEKMVKSFTANESVTTFAKIIGSEPAMYSLVLKFYFVSASLALFFGTLNVFARWLQPSNPAEPKTPTPKPNTNDKQTSTNTKSTTTNNNKAKQQQQQQQKQETQPQATKPSEQTTTTTTTTKQGEKHNTTQNTKQEQSGGFWETLPWLEGVGLGAFPAVLVTVGVCFGVGGMTWPEAFKTLQFSQVLSFGLEAVGVITQVVLMPKQTRPNAWIALRFLHCAMFIGDAAVYYESLGWHILCLRAWQLLTAILILGPALQILFKFRISVAVLATIISSGLVTTQSSHAAFALPMIISVLMLATVAVGRSSFLISAAVVANVVSRAVVS